MEAVRGLLDFIQGSPTAFHAVANIGRMLEGAGYRPIRLRSYVSDLFEAQYGREPEIPLSVYDDPFAYRTDEPFCCMNLAHSPRYAPKEAAALIGVIARYMDLVSAP